jgi:uncharacterized spore protein YtfJ
MSEVETLLKATITEMERLLSSKTVIGEPITAGENTVEDFDYPAICFL